jgi:DNA-binding transcriptional MerR regulator
MQGKSSVVTKLLKAGELARKANLLVTTVRFYTKIGLLPADGQSPGKYNLYNEERALQRLHKIESLKKQRYTLEEIMQNMKKNGD